MQIKEKGMSSGFRMSPQQKHLWLLEQTHDGPAYGARCSILVEGGLDVEALKAALRKVVQRHEILRTTFTCPAGLGLALQVIAGSGIPAIHEAHSCGRLGHEFKRLIGAASRPGGNSCVGPDRGPG